MNALSILLAVQIISILTHPVWAMHDSAGPITQAEVTCLAGLREYEYGSPSGQLNSKTQNIVFLSDGKFDVPYGWNGKTIQKLSTHQITGKMRATFSAPIDMKGQVIWDESAYHVKPQTEGSTSRIEAREVLRLFLEDSFGNFLKQAYDPNGRRRISSSARQAVLESCAAVQTVQLPARRAHLRGSFVKVSDAIKAVAHRFPSKNIAQSKDHSDPIGSSVYSTQQSDDGRITGNHRFDFFTGDKPAIPATTSD